jgi:hypothetical protein
VSVDVGVGVLAAAVVVVVPGFVDVVVVWSKRSAMALVAAGEGRFGPADRPTTEVGM